MKRIISSFVLAATLFTSCSKSKNPYVFTANDKNEIHLTITSASGMIRNIDTTGSGANMGCGFLYGGTFMGFKLASNEELSIVYVGGNSCISAPGTYSFSCRYTPPPGNQPPTNYSNQQTAQPGTITFTTYRDKYAEGYFNAVCKNNMDSVLVKGTFKGNMNY